MGESDVELTLVVVVDHFQLVTVANCRLYHSHRHNRNRQMVNVHWLWKEKKEEKRNVNERSSCHHTKALLFLILMSENISQPYIQSHFSNAIALSHVACQQQNDDDGSHKWRRVKKINAEITLVEIVFCSDAGVLIWYHLKITNSRVVAKEMRKTTQTQTRN